MGYVWRMVEASVLLLFGIKSGDGTRGRNGFQNKIHGEYVLTVVFRSLESSKAGFVFVARKFGYNGRSRKEKILEMWRARQSY